MRDRGFKAAGPEPHWFQSEDRNDPSSIIWKEPMELFRVNQNAQRLLLRYPGTNEEYPHEWCWEADAQSRYPGEKEKFMDRYRAATGHDYVFKLYDRIETLDNIPWRDLEVFAIAPVWQNITRVDGENILEPSHTAIHYIGLNHLRRQSPRVDQTRPDWWFILSNLKQKQPYVQRSTVPIQGLQPPLAERHPRGAPRHEGRAPVRAPIPLVQVLGAGRNPRVSPPLFEPSARAQAPPRTQLESQRRMYENILNMVDAQIDMNPGDDGVRAERARILERLEAIEVLIAAARRDRRRGPESVIFHIEELDLDRNLVQPQEVRFPIDDLFDDEQ
ncbi:hypothetical protein B0J14DRAFT_604715 [Halenospora varia]|nr:hypothetical protein B0J14DRAFT_604715 [Halenospora varia]